jgi:hypothetical protein
VKHLLGAPMVGLLALQKNIRLDWKKFTRDKNASLFRKLVNYGRKKVLLTRHLVEVSSQDFHFKEESPEL